LGANYVVRNWQTEDGLPQSSVLSIAQTPDGYLTGSPGALRVIETPADVALGLWTEAGTVDLDEAGQGVLSLGGNTAEPLRFYRWSER
jgi:hypothetical protein